MQLAISFGILWVDCFGLVGSWRWMSLACLAFAPVWVLILLVVPESPTYLLAQRKFDDARLSLQFLRGHTYVEAELANIQTAVDDSLNHNVATADFFRRPEYCRPLLISLFLMTAQQLSGVNAVLFFSVSIFEAAGTPLNSFVEAIVVGVVQVVGTVASAVAVDRAGRRILLLLSALAMAVGLTGMGVYFWLLVHSPETASSITFLPLVSMGVFILFFALGFGPVPWLMMGELFTPEAKEKASAISASFNWFLATMVTQFYGPLAKAVGAAATFWTFAVLMALVLITTFFLVPETKGRTLEEIQDMFRQRQARDEEDENEVIREADGVLFADTDSDSRQQLVSA